MPATTTLQPAEDQCDVPGCTRSKAKEDCCAIHGMSRVAHNAPDVIPNDGVIDWMAIELAVEGARQVRLTWVEKDIATAILVARGIDVSEAAGRVGLCIKTRERRQRIKKLADVIRREGVPAHD